MFRRVILESWHEYVPYICFALIAGVFLAVVVRALRMPKSDVEHLASMPLRDDEDLPGGPPSTSTSAPDPDPDPDSAPDSDSDSDSDIKSR